MLIGHIHQSVFINTIWIMLLYDKALKNHFYQSDIDMSFGFFVPLSYNYFQLKKKLQKGILKKLLAACTASR